MTGQTDPEDVSQRRHPARTCAPRFTWLLVTVSLAAIPALAACGTAAGHAASGQAASRQAASPAVSAACTQVGAALSDGPDPDADPVGYAEAQIGPLHAIRTSDPALRSAIRALAAAYASVFARDGKDQSATRAVSAATTEVNSICPGAAS